MKIRILILFFAFFSLYTIPNHAQEKKAGIPTIKVGSYTFYPEVIEKNIKKKIQYFNSYTNVLVNKQGDYKNAVDLAMHLFGDQEDVKVDITDLKGNHTIKNIRKYLVSLSQLKYDKVEINDHDVVFITELVKQPDGTYTGTAKLVQNFTAIKDGKVVYDDTVEKTFTIILRIYEVVTDGKTQEKVDIVLGNMSVTNILKA